MDFIGHKIYINEGTLTFNSGPIKGKIKINEIRKIEHHSGIIVPVTFKPALNTKGLVVYYNRYDEIYISPKKEAIFLEELLKINPKIEVV